MSSSNTYKRDLVRALDRLASSQDVVKDTHGNVSLLGDDGLVYIKPSGVPYGQVSSRTVSVATMDLDIVAGELEPSVDLCHHVSIYRNNPHVRAICHTHSPHAVAHAVAGFGIPCYTTEQADYFGGFVRCLPYADLNSWGTGVVLYAGERAVLLSRHGALTFGKTADETVSLAVALENVAHKNFLSALLCDRVPPNAMPSDEIAKWHERYMNVYGQKK